MPEPDQTLPTIAEEMLSNAPSEPPASPAAVSSAVARLHQRAPAIPGLSLLVLDYLTTVVDPTVIGGVSHHG